VSTRCGKCGAPVEEPARCLHGHAQTPVDPLDRVANLVADRLADRIAERLELIAAAFAAVTRSEQAELVDAAEIGRMLGKRREWVYRHREQLGGVPLGEGPRPRWGFAPDLVRARLEQRNNEGATLGTTSPGSTATPRPLPAAELLPVKGKAA
jgi:hypothetical protein